MDPGEEVAVTLDERFAKVVGRSPSEAERERLQRLRDALDVQDNDALWAIVMALEFYDSLYREYPERLAAETSKAIDGARQAFAEAARLQAAQVHSLLAKQVARTGAELARVRAGRSITIPWVVMGVAAHVGFGALCMAAGAVLEHGGRPWWARSVTNRWMACAGVMLGAPAGWMMLALLLPVAARTAWNGWRRTQSAADAVDVWMGTGIVVGSAVLLVGCSVLLAEVL